MAFDVKKLEPIEELGGKLASSPDEDRLMRSILDNDKTTIENGKLLAEAINTSAPFNPDLLFENLVSQFSLTKSLYGPSFLRQLTGYSTAYLEKNIRIPEFQRQLKTIISERIERLKEDKFLDREDRITDHGLLAAALLMYVEELDSLPQGYIGDRPAKDRSQHGEPTDRRPFKRGDRFRDIDVRGTVKAAIRRGHVALDFQDLRALQREKAGKLSIAFCVDASGSMKGEKLEACKKAGIALAFRALTQGDDVALVVFGPDVRESIAPSRDFIELLRAIADTHARQQTDIAQSLHKALEMLDRAEGTKHIILLTDALPTVGKEPDQQTLRAAMDARDRGITISLIGIKLDAEGRKLAEKIVDIGKGRLYAVNATEGVDRLVLEDYDHARG